MNTFPLLLLVFSLAFNMAMLWLMVKWTGRAKTTITILKEMNAKYLTDITYNKGKLTEIFKLLDTLNKLYSGQPVTMGQPNGRADGRPAEH